MRLNVLLVLFFVSGCATQSYQSSELKDVKSSFIMEDVPFISGQEYHCGPSSFSMILKYLDYPLDDDQSVSMLYTPEKKGTHQQDIIIAARRLGLLSIPIKSFDDIIIEIDDYRPILVFKNLSLNWAPLWHYAVVVGYDLTEQEIILHSGENEFEHVSFRRFKRMWERTDNWAYAFSYPEDIPKTATEHNTLKSIASLEMIGKNNEALLSYEAVLERWKNSLGALIGLGNVHYNKGDYLQSYNYLKKAHELSPHQEAVKHNLSIVRNQLIKE